MQIHNLILEINAVKCSKDSATYSLKVSYLVMTVVHPNPLLPLWKWL